MSDFGDLIGSIFGGGGGSGDAVEGVADVVAGLFGSGRENEGSDQPQIVYERFLCGGPKSLNINDR